MSVREESRDAEPAWRDRHLGLAAVIASAALVGFAFGGLIPLISVLLERAGHSSLTTGLNAATSIVAILLIAPFAPRLAARFGTLPTLYLGVALIALSAALFPVLDSLAAWFVLRFVAGLGVALHWVVSETWINLVAEQRRRGQVIALYVMVLAGGFALGPATVGLVGSTGPWAFWIIALATVIAALPFVALGKRAPAVASGREGDFLPILRRAPLVVIAGFLAGIADNASWVLLPIYGLRSGLGEAAAFLMVAAFVAGSVVIQLPLGWLSDRIPRARVLAGAGFLGLLGALFLPTVTGGTALWPLLFFWGGIAIGLYTLSLAMLGETFAAADLARANAVFIFAYNAGNLIGPVAGGAMMERLGPEGLPGLLAAVYGVVLAVALLMGRRAAPRAADNLTRTGETK